MCSTSRGAVDKERRRAQELETAKGLKGPGAIAAVQREERRKARARRSEKRDR